MKFSTENIKKNLKTVSSLNSEFVYMDVANSKIYFSSDNQAIQLDVPFEEVKEDEKDKVFVIEKGDFIHIVEFTNTVYMDNKYQYHSEDNQIKGKFNHNDNYADTLDSIKVMFTNTESYKEMATIDDPMLASLIRGNIFVNENDIKQMYQNLNIKDNKIFSSSEFRIYLNTINNVTDGIIHASVLKYMIQLGVGTKIYNNEDSYLLVKDNISMYFSTMSNVDYIPLLSPQFQEKYMSIFECNKLTFNVGELLNKLNFISFYAKNSASNVAFLTYDEESGEASISTSEENHISVKTEDVKITENEGSLRLPFNAVSLQNIVSKLGNTENVVSLYVSKDDNTKLFILEFSSDEIVILSKINA